MWNEDSPQHQLIQLRDEEDHHLEQSLENQDQLHQEVSVENLDDDIVENHP